MVSKNESGYFYMHKTRKYLIQYTEAYLYFGLQSSFNLYVAQVIDSDQSLIWFE